MEVRLSTQKILLLMLALAITCCTGGPKSRAVTSGSVDVGNARLFYDEAGTGGALVMIHGGLLTKEMWDGLFEKYARDYRPVRYDVRNHGLSRSGAAEFAHFEDLDNLMKHLKIDKAVVMGLSMGGSIAIDFALKRPEKVAGLILVAPGLAGFPFRDPESENYFKKLEAANASGDAEKIIEVFMEAWVYGPGRKAEDIDPAVREKVRAMARKSFAAQNDQAKEFAAAPLAVTRLKDLQAPTLAIVGDLDMPAILEIVGLLEKSVPHFEKVVIPGAAHLVSLEKPAQFDRAVRSFLEKVYGAR
jgi:pimeloyl-ACP methyl ester carboxylesterase